MKKIKEWKPNFGLQRILFCEHKTATKYEVCSTRICDEGFEGM